MKEQFTDLLTNPTVRAAIKKAWNESEPGAIGGHEEGGFILREEGGNFNVARWPKGAQDTILLPPYQNCKFENKEIVATFHTHPNTGSDYLQEPSETDRASVRDDSDLKGEFYLGEFVISNATIYLITPSGMVSMVGDRVTFLDPD